MELKAIVAIALRDPGEFPALEEWIARHRHRYQRPREPNESESDADLNAFIDEYSDWQIRIDELNRVLRELQAPISRDGDPHRVERARLVHTLAGLFEAPFPRGVAAFTFGYLLGMSKRYFDAVDRMTEAEQLFRQANAPREAMDALSWRTSFLHEDKRHDETIQAAGELVRGARANGFRGHEASGLRDLGLAQAALGREPEALDALRQGLAVRRALSPEDAKDQFVATLPAFLDALGTTARTFGLYDEAVRAFVECVEIHKADGDDALRALASSEIGYTYLQNGNRAKAVEYLEHAVDLAERTGPTPNAKRWKLQIGMLRRDDVSSPSRPRAAPPDIDVDPHSDNPDDAHLAAELSARALMDGDHETALALATRVLEWADAHADRSLQVVSLNTIGAANSALDRYQDAVSAFQRGIQLADRGGGGTAAAMDLRYNLAKAFIRSRQYQHAIDVLLAGFGTSEELLSRTDSFASRQQITAAALGLYELMASIASHKDEHANHTHLLALTEGVRARNMAAWAAAAATLEGATGEGEVAARLATDLQALRSVEVELDLLHQTSSLTLDRANLLVAETKRLRSAIADATMSSAGRDGEWRPYDALDETLPHVVTSGEAVLALFCVPEGVCPVLVSVGGDGEIVTAGRFIPWERSERIEEISRWTGTAAALRTRAIRARTTGGRGSAGGLADVDDARDACDRMRAAIRARLLSPLAELVKRFRPSRLAIIPHRELALLPYWDLFDDGALEAFTLAPSLNLLRICRARVRETIGRAVLIDDATRNLPFASRELDGVRQLRTGPIDVARTVADVMRLGPDTQLLHAAAHGMFNAANPYYSGIVVGGAESATGLLIHYVDLVEEAGDWFFQFSPKATEHSYRLLTVAECISRLSLGACRLAVVSSCECGLADPHGGGELTSVPTSLLVAGAKTVVAAMWPVEDGATMLLMDRFYRHWAGGRGAEPRPAVALAAARQDLRRMDRSTALGILGADAVLPPGEHPYAHPLYADAFQCFGDW